MNIDTWIGVDPGLHGACALMKEGRLELFDFHSYSSAASKLTNWLIEHKVTRIIAALEKITYHHVQGRKTNPQHMAKLLKNAGAWEGILETLAIPYVLVPAYRWQVTMLKPFKDAGNTKKQSLAAARDAFPDFHSIRLEKHHNRADAINICHWCKLNLKNDQDIDMYRKVYRQ